MRGLHARYARRVQAFVRGVVRDEHAAADITQDVFTKIFLKASSYQPGTRFRCWLLEIARNQALTALRAIRRRPRPISGLRRSDSDLVLATLVEQHEDHRLEEAELMDAFRHAVDELPEPYRDVFNRCVRDGASYRETAEALHLPAGTVGIRVMRARKRLFATLGKHLGRVRRPPACFGESVRKR